MPPAAHHLPASLSAPSPVASAGCVPGRNGIPHGVAGNLLCGRWAMSAPSAIDGWLHHHGLLALCVVVGLVVIRGGWAGIRGTVWRRHAAQARWLEIIPPVTASPAATVALWQLLATLLAAPRWGAVRPARLVWEVQSTPAGARCGLWIPPGINPTAVLRILHRAWPGVRAEQQPAPRLARPNLVSLAVTPTRPEWQPLVEEPTPAPMRSRESVAAETDRLRAVYDALAAGGRTGGALLQVVVGRASGRRVAGLRRASLDPRRVRRSRGRWHWIDLSARLLRATVVGVCDLLTPGPARNTARAARLADPYLGEVARQARVKYASAPHLLIAVRATASGPTRSAARAAAADITSGLSLITPHLTRHRLHRRSAIERRWAVAGRMSVATVAETAAFTGLPAEPAAYGLPAAASRRRAATRDTFTTN